MTNSKKPLKKRLSGRVSHDNQPEKGNWFVRFDFWVIPNSILNDFRVPLRDFADRFEKAKRKRRVIHTKTRPDEILEGLDEDMQWLARWQTEKYNAQPKWHLRNLHGLPSDRGGDVLQEFRQLAKAAAESFDWQTADFFPGMNWREHGWKRISYESIGDLISERKVFFPPQVTLDIVGSREKQVELFRRAAERDPRAVARLWHLFPNPINMQAAIRHLFSGNARQARVPTIPSLTEVAGEYARVAVNDPESGEADVARKNIEVLVSRGAALGADKSAGRPRVGWHEEIIQEVYRMSYCLCSQICEVSEFLDSRVGDEGQRAELLGKLYGSLTNDLGKCLDDLQEAETSTVACDVAGKFLNISASKISQVFHKSKRTAEPLR